MKRSVVSVMGLAFLSIVSCAQAITYSKMDANIIRKLPQDMSFCIADIKYNDKVDKHLSADQCTESELKGSLKILEFGEGARSRFKGHKPLGGPGGMWAFYWNYVAQFNVPVWLVSVPDDAELREEMNMQHFFKIGGREVENMHALKKAIEASLVEQFGTVTQQHRTEYSAIVMIRKGRPIKTVKKLKAIYPNIIFVGEMSNKFVNNKYRMSLLFMTDELKKYRPECRSCAVSYTPTLAQSLIDDLKCDIFVLKPINSSRGRGILMVAKEDLDATLKLLFEDSSKLLETNLSEEYKYWATYKSPYFLVEQYEPSKSIIIDGSPYDATMRLVFSIDCCNERVNVNIFDGYWKLPAQPITADCCLTDKHKSHILPGLLSSVKIDAHDMEQAKKLLDDALRKVYWQMVQTRLLLQDDKCFFGDIMDCFDM